MLVMGRGGTAVELGPDMVLAFLPLEDSDIERLLKALRCSRLFKGVRVHPPVDLLTVAFAIGRLARGFVADPTLIKLETNPLAVPPAGGEFKSEPALSTPLPG